MNKEYITPDERLVAVLGEHVRVSWAEVPFTCSCDPTVSDARGTHHAHLAAVLTDAGYIHKDEVKQIVNEVITNLLHPEFGSEWMEPDGIVYKAVEQAKAQLLREQGKKREKRNDKDASD